MHIIAYLVDLGIGLIVAAAAVWYIEPTTAGGILVIFVVTTAAFTWISRLIRGMFKKDETKLVKPERFDFSVPHDKSTE